MAAPDLNRRVNQLRHDVDDVYDLLDHTGKTLTKAIETMRVEFTERFERLESTQGEQRGLLDKQGGRLDRLDGLLDKQGGRLDRLDDRLDRLDGRLDSQGGLLGQLSDRVDQLDERLDRQGDRLDRQGDRLDRHEGLLERQGVQLDLHSEMLKEILQLLRNGQRGA